jgi:predicted DNA-binding transcriptional regulator AlpA
MTKPKPARLIDYDEIQERTGIPYNTLRVWKVRGKMPEPDYTVGQSPAWLPAHIEPWIEEHSRKKADQNEESESE